MAIAAYVVATRLPGADRDGTTEVAAILVAVLGAMAGAGSWWIAAAAGSLVVLALNEKKRLHGAVTHVHPEELSAALRFAVLALVVLPLLPEGPFLGWAAIRPRALWFIVLLLSAINFAGFLARRMSAEGRGYLLTGLLGGVISSTAVALGFARFSRRDSHAGTILAIGVVGACMVLVPRVLVISAVLNQEVAVRLAPIILPAGIVGVAIFAVGWKYATQLAGPGIGCARSDRCDFMDLRRREESAQTLGSNPAGSALSACDNRDHACSDSLVGAGSLWQRGRARTHQCRRADCVDEHAVDGGRSGSSGARDRGWNSFQYYSKARHRGRGRLRAIPSDCRSLVTRHGRAHRDNARVAVKMATPADPASMRRRRNPSDGSARASGLFAACTCPLSSR